MHAVGIASAAVLYQIILSNRTTNAEYLATRHLKQLSALISLTCLLLGILIHVGTMHTATPPRKHVLVCYSLVLALGGGCRAYFVHLQYTAHASHQTLVQLVCCVIMPIINVALNLV